MLNLLANISSAILFPIVTLLFVCINPPLQLTYAYYLLQSFSVLFPLTKFILGQYLENRKAIIFMSLAVLCGLSLFVLPPTSVIFLALATAATFCGAVSGVLFFYPRAYSASNNNVRPMQLLSQSNDNAIDSGHVRTISPDEMPELGGRSGRSIGRDDEQLKHKIIIGLAIYTGLFFAGVRISPKILEKSALSVVPKL